jgi:hypothetical protein
MFGIRRSKDIERSAILDLRCQLRRGTVAEDHLHACLRPKRPANLPEYIHEIGGCRDG